MKKLVNANSDGGKDVGRMTEEECLQKCLDKQPHCVAFDYRRSEGFCDVHTSGSAKALQWNDCCNRYQIVCDKCT